MYIYFVYISEKGGWKQRGCVCVCRGGRRREGEGERERQTDKKERQTGKIGDSYIKTMDFLHST